MSKLKVINMFGGPSCGKSTVSAGLFYKMKIAGYSVELVTEFAKDLFYSNQLDNMLDQQEYIFAEQNYRLFKLKKHVEYAITDSPLLLSLIYKDQTSPTANSFNNLVIDTWNLYDNINIYLNRPQSFQKYGRRHTLEESKQIDNNIRNILTEQQVDYDVFNTTKDAAEEIFQHLFINK